MNLAREFFKDITSVEADVVIVQRTPAEMVGPQYYFVASAIMAIQGNLRLLTGEKVPPEQVNVRGVLKETDAILNILLSLQR